AQGTTEPTARNFDCTATPHCSAFRSHATIEYVATTASAAIGQLAKVERGQIASIRWDEDGRHLGARERGFDFLGSPRADRDGRAVLVSDMQSRLVGDVLEHECAVDVQLSLHRELGNAAAGGAEPAFSHSVSDSPGWIACTSTPLAYCSSSSGVPGSNGNVP